MCKREILRKERQKGKRERERRIKRLKSNQKDEFKTPPQGVDQRLHVNQLQREA